MYTINIRRYKNFSKSTLGDAILTDAEGKELLKFKTCEPEGPDTTERNKDKRIPQGTYKVEWLPSTQTGNNIKGVLPLIYNEEVPKDRYIRMHVGNNGKDTLGCILPGTTADDKVGTVAQSTAILTKILDIICNKEVKIVITNDGV